MPTSFEPLNTVRCVGKPFFRNQLVRDAACLLDVDTDVVSWSCGFDPLVPAEGLARADLTAVRAHGTELLLVDDGGDDLGSLANEGMSKDLRVLHRGDIEGVRLDNAKALLRYARWRVPLGDRVRLLALLDQEGALPLIDCMSAIRETREAMGAVAALVLHRFLDMDLDQSPIGPETRVIRRRD